MYHIPSLSMNQQRECFCESATRRRSLIHFKTVAVDLGLEEENPSYRGRKLLWLTYDTEVGSYSVDPAERVLKRIRRIVIRRRWLHTVSKAQRSFNQIQTRNQKEKSKEASGRSKESGNFPQLQCQRYAALESNLGSYRAMTVYCIEPQDINIQDLESGIYEQVKTTNGVRLPREDPNPPFQLKTD